jgi:hypothetical protein
MDLNLERIAFGTIVGVTGAAVAAGAGRERNQQINLGEKFDEIAGADGAGFHEALMRVARIASAHEYVDHVMTMNLGLFEGQMRGVGEGQWPWDVRPEDVMTNATGRNGIADDGRRHRYVVYKGSESEYVVGPDVRRWRFRRHPRPQPGKAPPILWSMRRKADGAGRGMIDLRLDGCVSA